MKSLLIKNGLLLSPVNGYDQVKKDILIEDGKIAQIADEINCDTEMVDASGCLVTPGLIDIHTHCFPISYIGLEPDVLGLERGATTIIDAGSSGAGNFEKFKNEHIDQAKTKVFVCLNVSKFGLEFKHELDSMDKIDEALLHEMVQKYPETIVGLKARASQSVVGEMGLKPIEKAAQIAADEKLPLVVHVGNYPPALSDVLNILNKDDVVTHAYHGKKGGILDESGKIIEEAVNARNRGVLFDVGHGVASFSFRVFEKALKEQFDCDMISTDLHIENYEGPVYNLAAVLSKMINCGETLQDAISKVTSVPARHFKLDGLGELKEGYIGDLSIMKLVESEDIVEDSIGDKLQLKNKLELVMSVYSRGEDCETFRHNIK